MFFLQGHQAPFFVSLLFLYLSFNMCSCPVCGICTASFILTFLTLPPLVSPIWQKSLSQRSLRSGQVVMDSEILLKLKEEVTCPICLKLLTEPLSLCCGHTFCQACITANNKESTVSKERESSCPVCQSSYQPGILQPNQHVANIVETLREANLSPEEEQKSDLCERHGEKLLLFCKEDGKFICWLCERSQQHRGHHTFLMEEVAQEYQVTGWRKDRTENNTWWEMSALHWLYLFSHPSPESCDHFCPYAYLPRPEEHFHAFHTVAKQWADSKKP